MLQFVNKNELSWNYFNHQKWLQVNGPVYNISLNQLEAILSYDDCFIWLNVNGPFLFQNVSQVKTKKESKLDKLQEVLQNHLMSN